MAAPSLALIPSAYKVGKVASVKPMNGKGDFTFTRNSEATRINENGIIETMGVDVPRIDHTDGGCPSLLLEPASTNIITYSEDFGQAIWSKNDSTVESASIPSPDGGLNAYKLRDSTLDARHSIGLTTGGILVGDDISFSIFAKKVK